MKSPYRNDTAASTADALYFFVSVLFSSAADTRPLAVQPEKQDESAPSGCTGHGGNKLNVLIERKRRAYEKNNNNKAAEPESIRSLRSMTTTSKRWTIRKKGNNAQGLLLIATTATSPKRIKRQAAKGNKKACTDPETQHVLASRGAHTRKGKQERKKKTLK